MAVEHEHIHEDHGHEPILTRETASVREPFGVAQAVSLAIGIFLVVIGAVGLARAGIQHLDTPRVLVGPFAMTPLLAIANIVLGLIGLIGAAGRAAARGTCMFLGPVLIAGGIIALIQNVTVLGWNRADGFAYVVCGAIAIVAAILTPVASTYEQRELTA